MARGGYVILNKFQVQPAQADAFARTMRDGAAQARGEEGVRQFEIHASPDQPTSFLLYEEFADHAAWQAHHERPATKELRSESARMVADNARTVWQQVEGFVNVDAPPGHSTVVHFRMKPADLQPMLAEMEPDARSARGMLRFDLNVAEHDPGAFLICARWADRESWQAHQSQPDYVAFRERTHGYHASPPDRTLWRPLR